MAQIVITEVMFDPASSENTDEFIEIYNLSEDVYCLDNWSLGDGDINNILISDAENLELDPGQYAIIFDNDYISSVKIYDDLVPSQALYLYIDGTSFGSRGLSNTRAERIVLYDQNGNLVDEYLTTPGNRPGYSDEKIRIKGDNGVGNWADARCPGGTPGYTNSVSLALNVRKFNILIEPQPFSPGNNGDFMKIALNMPTYDNRISVFIYLLTGRKVKSLAYGRDCGSNIIFYWDGNDEYGQPLSTGLYVLYVEYICIGSGFVHREKQAIVLAR
ncbi:lamin tail domain-containing protein [bacterium]|nr:lamin tail domain-containing protein [bacterium]